MRPVHRTARRTHGGLFLSSFLLLAVLGYAQPSGGPYGPIDQRYEIPKAAHVFYVAPNGVAESPGTDLAQPTTLESAMERVVTGDAVVLRGGVYRTGGLVLNQGITMQPYGDERPVLKGTQVAVKWEALRDNVWRTPWKRLFPAAPLGWWQRGREGMRTPLHRFNNDMVFLDGELLQSAGWEGELTPKSYFIDYQGGYVYLGVNPANHLVEITAFDSALVRTSSAVHGKSSDHKGPVIRGIAFTQYAYRALEVEGKKHFTAADEPTDEPVGPSDPSTYGKEVTGTVLENVSITYCSRVAGYFRGDGLVIRQSLISDTSTEGLYVIGSSDVLLERNIIRRNNIEQLTGYYPAAVKIFNQSHRVTVRDNLILDNPNSSGVWYDVGNRDAVFVNNWVDRAVNGFFFEISRGATVAGNVFLNCDRGVYILNSAGARIYNNTFLDAPASFERNQRSATGDHFGWHPATGPGVDQREGHVFVNNLLAASEASRRPLLRFEQPAALCAQLPRPQAQVLDGNVYARAALPGVETKAPLATWGPAATESCVATAVSLEELRGLASGFEAGGRQLDRTPRSVFQGVDVGRYELLQPLPGLAGGLPADVRKLLGWSEQEARTTGAYPVGR
ncbi:right-handed parallel beta-helix repeat-containing protein [Paludibaculum fermentans]|uniref:Right-handed parallel beta-helix repeat-containing protein n=1 Tax=Paludibaculum fermentans TaxID=1473598 RepID=A0A7S7SK20_PALFE|nr:right-handed parallel beta-helix repeat-containing protein [Paludibaculum fermentans]QOY88687.1 right-handed parallel beta-helix repeat-containing protein [Paludibaculum fermentans]